MCMPCLFLVFLVTTTVMIIKESDDDREIRKGINCAKEMKQFGSVSRLLCCEKVIGR